MLEVNDFNAVRISLASPEQIRSWSYGEVTKPETINYRTLKPEKDGLFCEKIFGPTKDFECYCGKYKRVRFKGIVCDKCGVEVTRAKVRRERMGHIELASPVSHIWFVKGTPSRLGLLLEISPRDLERVLYFAQYLITWVDDAGIARAREEIEEEVKRTIGELAEGLQSQIADLKGQIKATRDAAETKKKEQLDALQEDWNAARAELIAESSRLQGEMRGQLGQAASEPIVFRGVVIVKEDAAINEDRIEELDLEAAAQARGVEEEFERKRDGIVALADAEADKLINDLDSEVKKLDQKLKVETDRIEKERKERFEEIDGVRVRELLTEAKYRSLRDKFSGLFRAGMGAEAVRDIVAKINLDDLREDLRGQIYSTSGQKRKRATKQLRVVEAFRKSGNRPEWMILTVLPVLPPDLRPMVQLDGGRFATSDLNDLYRRVINRNNRLKRLIELSAPEIIIRNEKRMLQEAVDSLIDNGRRGRAVSSSSNHKLKSLSDMLKGKQGRFRQNLLGKRVDYSGRSVIVVGPNLKLHQCGLPKRMALELFKPFVMRRLVERQYAHNIKSAKRVVERVRPEVWDVLEEVIEDRPVLLNRAPTLHRLGIQAFQPVLIDGSAIQIHPLVCSAFNADFDGDQMAVHVPLSRAAVEEAKKLMLSTQNLLSPSSGEPVVAPTLDMVLGCYYMTLLRPGAPGENTQFADFDEAKLAYDLGIVDLQAEIEVPVAPPSDPENPVRIRTTVGRIIFNEILPEALGYWNEVMDKKALKRVVAECYRVLPNDATAQVVDEIKRLGFDFATRSGVTIAVSDIQTPPNKAQLLADADQRLADIERQYRRGLISDEERYQSTVDLWSEVGEQIAHDIEAGQDRFGSIHMMANSGAKGNIAQIRQMAGMRGLMTDPSGRIIDLPIRSSFREGLSVLEYFISTHGARKGLADTALRTADSGYLTRRLIDVAQDVIVREEDCGTRIGIIVDALAKTDRTDQLGDRLVGRINPEPIRDPNTFEELIPEDTEVDHEMARDINRVWADYRAKLKEGVISKEHANRVIEEGIHQLMVRSPLTCRARHGVCRRCYGWSLARGHLVEMGEAVGIIAAQSIGEPGTQLTMRTFHTGGVASVSDITSGLPRVEELFEARNPKGQATISEIDGVVEVLRQDDNARKIKVISTEVYRDEHAIPDGYTVLASANDHVVTGDVLAVAPDAEGTEVATVDDEQAIRARIGGIVTVENGQVVVTYEEREEREYSVPANARIDVDNGQRVQAGQRLTDGSVNPQDILRVLGRDAVQLYLVEQVQQVYQQQGVAINDKHIETIVRQMLRKVRVDSPGDTELLPGELVDRARYEEINAAILAEGGEPATAQTVLLGVTKASLNTDSFLAAASFQETTRVLTEAAITGTVDRLFGLKENVIIGKLIPAGTGLNKPKRGELPEAEELEALEDDGFAELTTLPAATPTEGWT
ncbi:MAG: DNA-directed RNA polymerase subunit beta' [Dehalococcoidia bacterium]